MVEVKLKREDGVKHKATGDTVICFTISAAKKFIEGKEESVKADTTVMGAEIPEPIYALTIAALMSEVIEQHSKGSKPQAAYALHTAANVLERRSKDLMEGTTAKENRCA